MLNCPAIVVFCPFADVETRIPGNWAILSGIVAVPALGETIADLCKLPVLFLLPNRLFAEFLDCTAFIGFLKAQQSSNNLHVGNGKLDIRGVPVLNPQLHVMTSLFSLVIHQSWMKISKLQDVEIVMPFEGNS
jgi:hypothetical protein